MMMMMMIIIIIIMMMITVRFRGSLGDFGRTYIGLDLLKYTIFKAHI